MGSPWRGPGLRSRVWELWLLGGGREWSGRSGGTTAPSGSPERQIRAPGVKTVAHMGPSCLRPRPPEEPGLVPPPQAWGPQRLLSWTRAHALSPGVWTLQQRLQGTHGCWVSLPGARVLLTLLGSLDTAVLHLCAPGLATPTHETPARPRAARALRVLSGAVSTCCPGSAACREAGAQGHPGRPVAGGSWQLTAAPCSHQVPSVFLWLL